MFNRRARSFPLKSPGERSWHLVTGEYPPSTGGVADYTASVARALADAGADVHVWAAAIAGVPEVGSKGVRVHRIPGGFSPAGLARLDRALSRQAGPRIVLIQYAPHAFGWKAMNLPFAAWVAWRSRLGDEVRVMFHEVAFPWVRRPIRHNVLAAANRVMAGVLARSCTRAYVSIPAWERLLRRLGPGRLPIAWTPIPSSIPGEAPAEDVGRRRIELTGGDPDARVVGHFGTYGSLITRDLSPVLKALLNHRPGVRVLLLGSGGDRWRRELIRDRPVWADRVIAPGPLPAPTVAEYLRACDLVIQPYPDGVSSRRTTVMAALANAVPVVTTVGALSESIWDEAPVATAAAGDIGRLVEQAEALLDSPPSRTELGRAGRRLYQDRFALRHTIDALLSAAP